MEMLNILVTGGAGYIGSHVVKQLLEQSEHRVTIIDNLSGGYNRTIEALYEMLDDDNKDRLSFIRLDLSHFDAVEGIFQTGQFDAVIHFAANIVVSESVEDPLKYYMNNTVNTTNIVKMCNDYGVGRMIFSSTAAVYGNPAEIPIRETTPLGPINPYGTSKLMSEQIIRDAAGANPDFDFVILRYFNVAGADPQCRIGEMHEPETHLIPLIVKTALGSRDTIKIFGTDYNTPDGTCIRDYIHVDDLASAHLAALSYLGTPASKESENIFNVGYGHGFSVREVIDTVKKVSKVDFKVEIAPRRAGDPDSLVADNTKMLSTLPWIPKHDNLEFICETALEWEKKASAF